MLHRNGLYFSVSLSKRMTIDEVAAGVSDALNISLAISDERGLQNDYVGELLGLHLWLLIADQPAEKSDPRFALIGGLNYDLDDDAVFLDISPYIAEFLTDRTGWSWQASGTMHNS